MGSDFLPLEPMAYPAFQLRATVRTGSGAPPDLAVLRERTRTSRTFGIRRVDTNGRVLARSVVRALNWDAGTAVTIECVDEELLVVRADRDRSRSANHDHLYLPAVFRRRVGIAANDQVLLVADPKLEVLLIGSVSLVADLLSDRLGQDGTE